MYAYADRGRVRGKAREREREEYIYIYMNIYREREKQRDKEREREKEGTQKFSLHVYAWLVQHAAIASEKHRNGNMQAICCKTRDTNGRIVKTARLQLGS